MRTVAFSFELLRGGAYCARLKAVSRTPTLRMNSADRLHMLLTGTFAPEAINADGRAVEIDWLNDEIRPIMILDGVEHPLGVYVPTKPRENNSGPVKSVSISAYDRCQKVARTDSEDLLFWPAGTLYLDAVEQLLTAAGIRTTFATPSDAVFATPREEWIAGTSYLDIANQLLGEISYKSLWFDAEGSAVLEPKRDPSADAIKHVLDTNDPGTRVVDGKFSRVRDFYDSPNVFIAVCQNPQLGTTMRAVAVNDNPQSPLSIPARGQRIASVEYLNNLPSSQTLTPQGALQAYVDGLRNDSMISGETLEVHTGLLPGWGVADVVGLNWKGETSICVSSAWTMDLRVGGEMVHKLDKVVYNLAT